MLISVDDNLGSLYEELKSMGYEVHKLSENINSDTVIYSEAISHLNSIYSSVPAGDGKGVFIVNGDNKSSSEVLNMIKNRVYTSLF